MKKEELEKENTRINIELSEAQDKDKSRREQFSSILEAPRDRTNNGFGFSQDKPTTYSWLEISAEIGKLLELRRQIYLEENKDRVFEENRRLMDIINKLEKDK
jgi:hypothetical protein